MDRVQLIVAFVRTVELGSLSAAAKELGTTQPTVSKWLNALETKIGARLLARNTRGIRLTDAGERYYEMGKRVLSELEETETQLAGLRQTLQGKLRLNVPVGLGEAHLTRMALKFMSLHPQLQVELTLTDRVVDLVEDGVDVAIRIGSVTDPNVVARPLGQFRYAFAATPAYLAKHRAPKKAEDLSEHNYLCYGYEPIEKLDTPSGPVEVPVKTNLMFNNSQALKTAVLASVGIGRCSRWLVDEEIKAGKLKALLPRVQPPPMVAHAVYLPSRYQPERIRRFVAFATEEISKIPGWEPTD